MKLRKHQQELLDIVDRIISGGQVRRIYIRATPGAGKSLLPIIAGKLIIAGMADALAWIVPRKSLQDQGERSFLDPFNKQLIGHGLTIRTSTNDVNPCRGHQGLITTYQAIGVDTAQTVRREFCERRYILILDEYHHVEKDGVWAKALEPLVDLAAFVILMTGTIERGDGKQIAFTRYAQRGYDLVPYLHSDKETAVIEYSRADALAEKAILPIQFHCQDAAVKWMTDTGREVNYDSLKKVTKKDASAAIYTALHTKYSEEMLKAGVSHWQRHRQSINPGAKCLVVTAGIEHAKKAMKILSPYRLRVDIATSHESKAAEKAIKAFKGDGLDILVTIAMAYEGLDVPQASHIACLTHIRSTPWIEQMVARAVRIDRGAGPYERQAAYIFCPDDPLFREIIGKIQAEQLPFVKHQKDPFQAQEQMGMFKNDEPGEAMAPGGIIPLSSKLTDNRELMFGPAPVVSSAPVIKTEREMETELRREIDRHVRSYARINKYKVQKINAELKDFFGKPREEMTRPELESLRAHLNKYYRLNRPHRGYAGSTIPRQMYA